MELCRVQNDLEVDALWADTFSMQFSIQCVIRSRKRPVKVPQQIEAVHVGPVRSEDPEALMASWGLTIIDKISIIYYKVSIIYESIITV